MRATPTSLVRLRRPPRDVAPLLPPVQLYRLILRAHVRKLPRELRALGDEYVKAEFHAHKRADNPVHIIGFLAQWQDYLASVDADSWREGRMTAADLDKMLPEQIGQLHELMQETKRIGSEDRSE